jgi:hypothetical protein
MLKIEKKETKGYSEINDGRKKKYQGNCYKNGKQFHMNFYSKEQAIKFTNDNKIVYNFSC